VKGVLLGPQQLKSSLREAVDAYGEGAVALVTCGWQEREDQDDWIAEQLGRPVENLKLYARGEVVLRLDREFARLHRKRQDLLRLRQDFYRLRLERAIDAALEIRLRAAGTPAEADEAVWSMEQIRQLDRDHLARCRELRQEFDEEVRPLERDAIVQQRRELARVLADARFVMVSGGHVAVMLNRLRMFGVRELLRDDHVLVAWSGGAMVTAPRVVLFHETPPHGQGISEVLDEGLGLHHGVLPLPNPRLRLTLHDEFRVGWMARRNEPEKCVALDHGDFVRFDGARWHSASGTVQLLPDGATTTEWAS
jgi:hypothetical protein